MRRRLLLACTVVLVAGLAAVSGQGAIPQRPLPSGPTPAATPAPPAPPAPPNGLVYAVGVRDSTLGNAPAFRYQVYTLPAAGTPRLAFTTDRLLPEPAGRVFMLPGTRHVLVNLDISFALYDLLTGARRDLYTVPDTDAVKGFHIYDEMALRADGTQAAFTEYRWEVREGKGKLVYHLKVLDLATGAARDLATSDQPAPGFRGLPAPVSWLKGGDALWLRPVTFSDACCPPWGRITTDGSRFEVLDVAYGYTSPDGAFTTGVNQRGPGIGCFTPPHELVLRDLATLQPKTVFTDPVRSVDFRGVWSPDSRALIFATYGLRASTRPGCEVDQDVATAQFYVADVIAAKVEPIAKDDRRIAEWRTPGGVPGVAIRCGNPDYTPPICDPATLEVNGVVVDRGGPFAVLGRLP